MMVPQFGNIFFCEHRTTAAVAISVLRVPSILCDTGTLGTGPGTG